MHNEAALLASCSTESQQLAVANQLRAIAFPAISCGIYGYPIPEAVRIAVTTTAAFLEADASIVRVLFACFGRDMLVEYKAALREVVLAAQPRPATID
jgi:O-acetyl-ADP-ribose deacetylase